jgi:ribosomal protein L40E
VDAQQNLCAGTTSSTGAWGRHVIHLICLRCNHANAAEAKFCSECGAGLLRKFCGRCHAINDAESHFCQSCGQALPAQPSVPPAAPMTPPVNVPDLTDVYAVPDEPPPVAAPAPSRRWSGESTTTGLILASEPARDPPVVAMKSHRTVLFGFVGGAAVVLAAALWSRSDQPGAPPADVPASAEHSVALPASEPAKEAEPPPAQPAPSPAPDGAARLETAPGANAVMRPATTVQPASKAPERRLTPEAQVAAHPPAAGPAQRNATPERRPAARSTQPTPPAPECTPQVDALGLCAPGAKVADKAGSR